MEQSGYLYVYLSHESATPKDVFFDDFRIKHTHIDVIHTTDYYAFGMEIKGTEFNKPNALKNQYLYTGKEKQDELNINWQDYGARMYMSDIGRWGVVDPLAEKYYGETPYGYTFNNPILHNDPTGMEGTVYGVPVSTFAITGSVAGVPKFAGEYYEAIKGQKGTIILQVAVDEKGVSIVPKQTIDDAVSLMNAEFERLGVDVRVKAEYGNTMKTKSEFYSRPGASSTDFYLVLGTNAQLKTFKTDLKAGGWDTPGDTDWRDSNGQAAFDDNLAFLNYDEIALPNGKVRNSVFRNPGGGIGQENYKTVADKINVNGRHEAGHRIFRLHPQNRTRINTFSNGYPGHVPGTIMEWVPLSGSQYDTTMLKMLKEYYNSK